MSVYDLNNVSYLLHDIDGILTKIDSLYRVEFGTNGTSFYPKRTLDKPVHWASAESNEAFNKIIPEIKSLHKDMYSIIESVTKARKGEFKIEEFERRYSNFKEFRLLNNKFKHFNNKGHDINLTQIVVMDGNQQLLDFYCNFKHKETFKTLRYCEFIDTFLRMMEDFEIIDIKRE